MRKLMYNAIAIVAVLVILVFTGRKSVHHEITIDATPEKVWQVLTDMEKYPEWNPTMQLVSGEVKEGNKVRYQFTQDPENVSEMDAVVVEVSPNEVLNQKGGMPMILTFDHRYIIEESGNQTKMTIHEDYAGIGVNFWNPKAVEEAYGRLNEALKARVESL
ncbi:MAG: SRPBCC domain-containing protein [Bacteroidota bacterium]